MRMYQIVEYAFAVIILAGALLGAGVIAVVAARMLVFLLLGR